MDWNLFLTVVTASLAPVTIWLAAQQLQHNRQLDLGQKFEVHFTDTGGRFLEMTVSYLGYRELIGLEVVLLSGSRSFSYEEVPQCLSPCQRLGPLLVPKRQGSTASKIFLSWETPSSATPSRLRRSALLVGADGEVKQWKYFPCFRLLLRCGLRLGYWKPLERKSFSDRKEQRMRPGWPTHVTTFDPNDF